jgi:hypothetical protein
MQQKIKPYEEWNQSARRLSEIEHEHFGWDHAQAGAWIIHNSNLPFFRVISFFECI